MDDMKPNLLPRCGKCKMWIENLMSPLLMEGRFTALLPGNICLPRSSASAVLSLQAQYKPPS